MLLCMRVLALLLAAAGLAAAHHSFAAEYDDTKPVKLMGKITKVEWMNPHVWYYVEVKDESGKTSTWALSGGAPGQLQRRGITKDAIVVGATVNVEGFRAKDGSNNAFGSRVVYEDGRSVFTAATDAYDPSTKK